MQRQRRRGPSPPARDDPQTAAGLVAQAYDAGAVGGSIEDSSADPTSLMYDFHLAVERVHAAETARSLPIPFVLTARAEGLLYRLKDLDDTIRRLQAFESVGADVLYAPGLQTLDEMRTVVASVGRPEIGVRRVSVGGAFSRVALRAFLGAATQMRAGRFDFVREMAEIQPSFTAATERGALS